MSGARSGVPPVDERLPLGHIMNRPSMDTAAGPLYHDLWERRDAEQAPVPGDPLQAVRAALFEEDAGTHNQVAQRARAMESSLEVSPRLVSVTSQEASSITGRIPCVIRFRVVRDSALALGKDSDHARAECVRLRARPNDARLPGNPVERSAATRPCPCYDSSESVNVYTQHR